MFEEERQADEHVAMKRMLKETQPVWEKAEMRALLMEAASEVGMKGSLIATLAAVVVDFVESVEFAVSVATAAGTLSADWNRSAVVVAAAAAERTCLSVVSVRQSPAAADATRTTGQPQQSVWLCCV